MVSVEPIGGIIFFCVCALLFVCHALRFAEGVVRQHLDGSVGQSVRQSAPTFVGADNVDR